MGDETTDNSDALDQGPPQPPQSVQVTTNRLNPPPAYHGLSPFWSGLLYGAGAGAVAGGPIGALVGAGVGTVRYLQTRNMIDHQARMVGDIVGEAQGLQRQVMDMMPTADAPTQKLLMQQLRLSNEGMTQFINEQDPAGRDKMERANVAIAGILSNQAAQVRDTATAQANAQRSLITNAAGTMRSQWTEASDTYLGVETQANKVLALANDPKFDPNKPINKELVASMLQQGVGGLYRENPMDYLTAVGQDVGGLSGLPGVAGKVAAVGGAVIGAVGEYTKSEQFKLSKDDYTRLAINMKSYAQKQAQQKQAALTQSAGALNATARQWGVFTPDTDLMGYINGGQKSLPITPTPELPPAPPPSSYLTSTPDRTRSISMAPRGVLPGVVGRVSALANKTAVDNSAQGLSQAQAAPLRPVN